MKSLSIHIFIVIVFLVGCMTKGKVLSYLNSHDQIKDSIEAKILRENPCPNLDSGISIGKVDTAGLYKYYGNIMTDDVWRGGIGDFTYIPINDNPLATVHDTIYKERLIKPNIDSLKKYIGKDTVKLPVDPRLLKAMNLSLKMSEDSLKAQHDVIVKQQQQLADTEAIKDKYKWALIWIGITLFLAIVLFVVSKIK